VIFRDRENICKGEKEKQSEKYKNGDYEIISFL
jgi:hypothetical protein